MASFTRRPASGLGILEKPSFNHFVFLVFQLKKCWSTIEYYSVLKHGATFFSLIYIYLSTTAVGTGKPPASSGDHRRQNLQPQSIYSTNTPKGSRGQDPGPHKKEKDRCRKTTRALRPGDTQATQHLQGIHCWYIEPRNREKSLRHIWQRFSCLLDEWIAKISKKKFFHGGFSRTPRSPRSNDLETQNDENSIMKSDKN